MGVIRTNAAAAMLGVSTNTLRSWERRFGYPEPRRTAGGHRQYDVAQVEALRCAFEETGNVSSAVSLARARGEGPATGFRLRSAFARFDELEADRVLEESLAVRSVERTADEVLLPGVETLGAGGEDAGLSAELGFAWRWATGWLAAQSRAAPAATRADAVVVFDASVPCDVDALHAQALELGLRRRGVRTLTLTVARPDRPAGVRPDADRLERALRAVAPSAVVLTGRRASLDALGRLVFAARRQGGDRVGVFDFRGALPDTGASTVRRLGSRAIGACDALVDHLDGREPERPRRGARVALRAVGGD
jgi:MerR family transcriptional regulator, light-induced transcriptional regulator